MQPMGTPEVLVQAVQRPKNVLPSCIKLFYLSMHSTLVLIRILTLPFHYQDNA